MIDVKFARMTEETVIPKYAKPGDAGMDLYALTGQVIPGNARGFMVKTGLKVWLPDNYELQVRPRSGMSAKTTVRVANAPGTVDSGYRNEIGVILINLSGEPQTIIPGERIAQFVLAHVEKAEIELIEAVDINTDRGTTGYGDSGRV